MEKQRGTTVAIVAALIIAVISLGVAFAAFSTTLNINGTATVQASNWNVFFASTSDGSKPSTAAALPSTNITINGSAQSTTANLSADTFTWAANLKKPGDSVKYTFYARNTGTYDAKVRSTLTPTVTCTFDEGTTGDADTFCASHIKYGIYKDSDCTTAVTANDPLTAATGYAQYWVKVELLDNFAQDGSDLPTTDVNVTAPVVTVTYDQN